MVTFQLFTDIPELIVLDTRPRKELHVETHYFTQCTAFWSSEYEIIYQIAKVILLYTVPLLFMSVAYCQIVRVLWTSGNIPGHTETLKIMNSGLYQNSKYYYKTILNIPSHAGQANFKNAFDVNKHKNNDLKKK